MFAILAHAHLGRIQKSLERVTRAFMPSPCYINRTRLQRNGMTNRIGKSSKVDIKEGNRSVAVFFVVRVSADGKKEEGRKASSFGLTFTLPRFINNSCFVSKSVEICENFREALFIIFLSISIFI